MPVFALIGLPNRPLEVSGVAVVGLEFPRFRGGILPDYPVPPDRGSSCLGVGVGVARTVTNQAVPSPGRERPDP